MMAAQGKKVECPICGDSDAICYADRRESSEYQCPRCGEFSLTGALIGRLQREQPTKRQRAIASSLIRERAAPYDVLTTKDYQDLFEAKDIPVLEKIDRLLIFFAQETQNKGVYFTPEYTRAVMAKTWVMNSIELEGIINLAQDMQYIRNDGYNIYIAPKGWERLAILEAPNAENMQGFVAMCFDPHISPIYAEAIRPAIESAGYMPFRIDKYEHTHKIDDEIIRQIRRSRFLVADLTKGRCNVYYEAGFAHGLRIPIFYTSRKRGKLHFDIRQYNCLFWQGGELDAFKTALAARIEATLGRGKYSAGSAP